MTPGARILLVDDDADVRMVVGLNLKLNGMEFGEAGDGEHAVKLLRSGRYAGCVLDIAMPKVDGHAVLRELQADGTLNKVAVIVLSGRSRPSDAIDALRNGAHAYLAKPFSPGAVAKAIEELVNLTPEEREEHRRRMVEHAEDLDRLGMPTI